MLAKQRVKIAASSTAMAPPAAIKGRMGWQAFSQQARTRLRLQQSLRSRSKIGHTLTVIGRLQYAEKIAVGSSQNN